MGTFERIRQTSPYLLAVFAVVFVGFFVISDLDPSSLMNRGVDYQSAEIAVVNGEKILYKDYAKRVNERIEQQRQQNPDPDFEINHVQIQKDVWNEMIEELLLKQEADKAGIFVSVGELRDVMFESPPDYLRRPFTDSAGNFDKRAYQQIISDPESILDRLPQTMSQQEKRSVVDQFRNDLIEIEKVIRQQKLMQSLQMLVGNANSMISPSYAELKYVNENSTANAQLIYFNPRAVSDNEIEVSDQEIQEYYNEHKSEYKQDPVRKMKFVSFKIVPSEKDSSKAEKNINRITRDLTAAQTMQAKDSIFTRRFRQMQGELYDYMFLTDLDPQKASYITPLEKREVIGPVELRDGTYFFRLEGKRSGENQAVKASHILINFNQNKDSALAEAKRIKSELTPENFAVMAMQLSQDKASARQGGDLGYFTEGQMVKPFEEAAFEAEEGSIVGPVESQFGYHIIYVQDKKDEEISFSEIKIAPKVSRITEKRVQRQARELQLDLQEGMNFDSAAAKYEVAARETQFFSKDEAVLGSLYLSSKAFETEVGEIVGPMELENYGIIVAQVVEAIPEGVTPLELKKEEIIREIAEQKKIEKLEPKAKDIYAKVRGLDSLSLYTSDDPTVQVIPDVEIKKNGFIPRVGRDVLISSLIFNLPVGKITEPIKGEKGYYIVQLLNKNVPDSQEIQQSITQEIGKLEENAMKSAYFRWFNAVKQNAEVEDHRAKFYKEY